MFVVTPVTFYVIVKYKPRHSNNSHNERLVFTALRTTAQAPLQTGLTTEDA